MSVTPRIAAFAFRTHAHRDAGCTKCDENLRAIDPRLVVPRLPDQNASVGVSIAAPKTAALYFDYIWSAPFASDPPPDDLVVYGATPFEGQLQVLNMGVAEGWWSLDELDGLNLVKGTPAAVREIAPERAIAACLQRTHAILATTVFDSTEAQLAQYQPGRTDVIVSAINSLRIVDESSLSWQQVVSFRSDQEARRKYRRLVHWLDVEMIGKSVNFIADDLAGRLEDYNWTLRKHGVKTILGSLSSMLEPSFIAAASAATMVTGYAAGSLAASLSALSLAVAKVAASVASARISYDDATRVPEIAFVHELSRFEG